MAKSGSQRELTPRQAAFVREYAVDNNATRAAIRAGYSEKTANREGSRLLSNVDIQAAIAEATAVAAGKAELTAERVIREVSAVAFSDIGDILDFSGAEPRMRPACEIPESARRAISSVKVRRYVEGKGEDAKTVEVLEFKLWDKLAAIDKAGKRLGLFPNKLEVTGKDGGPVEYIEVRSGGHQADREGDGRQGTPRPGVQFPSGPEEGLG